MISFIVFLFVLCHATHIAFGSALTTETTPRPAATLLDNDYYQLFAVLSGTSCAETLVYGPSDININGQVGGDNGAYLSTDTPGKDSLHTNWLQIVTSDGVTELFRIYWTFQTPRTLADHFSTAVSSGETVSYRVVRADGTNYFYSGVWWFSDQAGDMATKFTTPVSVEGFSANDGAWGGGQGTVNGDRSMGIQGEGAAVQFWGVGNFQGIDFNNCIYVFQQSSPTYYPNVKTFMYYLTEVQPSIAPTGPPPSAVSTGAPVSPSITPTLAPAPPSAIPTVAATVPNVDDFFQLFAVLSGTSCAETLVYGPSDINIYGQVGGDNSAYLSTDTPGKDSLHTNWLQIVTSDGVTELFRIYWTFQTPRTLADHFSTAVSSGETVSYRVVQADGTNYFYNGVWWFSDQAGDMAAKFATPVSVFGFSANDGAWGGGQGVVNGDGPMGIQGDGAAVQFWGVGNFQGIDFNNCVYVYQQSAPTYYPHVKTFMYYSTEVQPSIAPTGPPVAPSALPTRAPVLPTLAPTAVPTGAPVLPTLAPTVVPTGAPVLPTRAPTAVPTGAPVLPTRAPTVVPTGAPVLPTRAPVPPTASPTDLPTFAPSSLPTLAPTVVPTGAPVLPTRAPVPPTATPSGLPSAAPITPTLKPTNKPTPIPTRAPTFGPTVVLTHAPVPPTRAPTRAPSTSPSRSPTRAPVLPTPTPTRAPSNKPSRSPTRAPVLPTRTPTRAPSKQPSRLPSRAPTRLPTRAPSNRPPSRSPTRVPTAVAKTPTFRPSRLPTRMPTKKHSKVCVNVVQIIINLAIWYYENHQHNCNDVMTSAIVASIPGISLEDISDLQVSQANAPVEDAKHLRLGTKDTTPTEESVSVEYTITVSSDSGLTFEQISAQLQDSVEANEFTARLQQFAAEKNVTALLGATSSSIETTDATVPDAEPSDGHGPYLGVGPIVGIAGGVCAVLALFVFFARRVRAARANAQLSNLDTLESSVSKSPLTNDLALSREHSTHTASAPPHTEMDWHQNPARREAPVSAIAVPIGHIASEGSNITVAEPCK